MRNLGIIGLVGAAGYALGRRHDELRPVVERLLRREDEPVLEAPRDTRPHRPSYDTEYDHLHETELAERHRIAEEIRSHPLGERKRAGERDPEVASQPLARERDDVVGPRPF